MRHASSFGGMARVGSLWLMALLIREIALKETVLRSDKAAVRCPKSLLADSGNAARLQNRKTEGRTDKITTSKTEDSKSVAECQKGRLMAGCAHSGKEGGTDVQFMMYHFAMHFNALPDFSTQGRLLLKLESFSTILAAALNANPILISQHGFPMPAAFEWKVASLRVLPWLLLSPSFCRQSSSNLH